MYWFTVYVTENGVYFAYFVCGLRKVFILTIIFIVGDFRNNLMILVTDMCHYKLVIRLFFSYVIYSKATKL